MKITGSMYLVGSGEADLMPTDRNDCQVYLIRANEVLALVDAGGGLSADKILANVEADGLAPHAISWLLLTHTHGDHAGGAAALKAALPGLRVAVSSEAADWLRRGDEQAISLDKGRAAAVFPPDFRFHPCPVDLELRDGQRIEFGGLLVKVVATPGHCRGHLSFLVEAEGKRALFSGDAIFPGGKILLQNIWDCDLQATLRSVERLAGLRADHLFAGHLHPVLDEAPAHLRLATDRLAALAVPPSLF